MYYVSIDNLYVKRKTLRIAPSDLTRRIAEAASWDNRAAAIEYALNLAREVPRMVMVDRHTGPASLEPIARFMIAKE